MFEFENWAVIARGGIPNNRAPSALDAPTIVGLDNGMTTQLILRMQPVANAKSYEVQTKNGGGWTPAGVFAQTRGIVLPGLTPGQNYSVQARAIGGSTGHSDWSDPASQGAQQRVCDWRAMALGL